MFKNEGGGGQRPFEQCSKKQTIWSGRASLSFASFFQVELNHINVTFFWIPLSNGDVLFGLLQCSLDSLRSSSAKVGSQTVNNYFLSSFSNYFPQTVNNYFLCCGDFVNIPYIQLHLRFCRQKINHYLLNADAVYMYIISTKTFVQVSFIVHFSF